MLEILSLSIHKDTVGMFEIFSLPIRMPYLALFAEDTRRATTPCLMSDEDEGSMLALRRLPLVVPNSFEGESVSISISCSWIPAGSGDPPSLAASMSARLVTICNSPGSNRLPRVASAAAMEKSVVAFMPCSRSNMASAKTSLESSQSGTLHRAATQRRTDI